MFKSGVDARASLVAPVRHNFHTCRSTKSQYHEIMTKMTHAYMRRQKNLVLVYAWACIHVLNESAQMDWLCVHSCTRVRLVQQFGAVYVCALISCVCTCYVHTCIDTRGTLWYYSSTRVPLGTAVYNCVHSCTTAVLQQQSTAVVLL
jgi:hypothetical protein